MGANRNEAWTASYNREKEWTDCCKLVSGFEWVDRFEDDEESNHDPPFEQSHGIHQIINLLGDDDDDDEEEEDRKQESSLNHWTENALRIHADLRRMAQWILQKEHEYISLEMADEEASLIQSTVTSFAATTASELETLRKIIPSSGGNISRHRSGIVQILLSQLQSQITEPFARLQKQRTRIAVHLWQNPQQCKLYQPSKPSDNNLLGLLDEDDEAEREQRFFPKRERPADDSDFLSKYMMDDEDEPELPDRPDFLERFSNVLLERDEDEPAEQQEQTQQPLSFESPKAKKSQPVPQALPYQQPEEARRQLEEDLQQESQLLTMAVNNDLDSVQKMEHRMVEITTLIGQFSNLVGEQQEEILQIHDIAKESKENIDKGQENLIDATERQKQSKHWLAWIIVAMSMTLLFFHTLRN